MIVKWDKYTDCVAFRFGIQTLVLIYLRGAMRAIFLEIKKLYIIYKSDKMIVKNDIIDTMSFYGIIRRILSWTKMNGE